MSNVAVIFGMQRCGSNFFLSACRRFDNLTVYGEMYHRGGVFPFQHRVSKDDIFGDFQVKQKLARLIASESVGDEVELLKDWNADAPYSPENNVYLNKILTQFAHGFPVRYFEAITRSATSERLIFKIFPEHLSLFQMLSILHKVRPQVILMERNPIDSFISYKKLVKTKLPQGVDTSQLKIDFNRAEYYEYKAQLVAYFKALSDFCREEEIRKTIVSYEHIHGDEGRDKLEKVRMIIAGVFDDPVQIRRDADQFQLFNRQDKSVSAAGKVVNPGRLPRISQQLIEGGSVY